MCIIVNYASDTYFHVKAFWKNNNRIDYCETMNRIFKHLEIEYSNEKNRKTIAPAFI